MRAHCLSVLAASLLLAGCVGATVKEHVRAADYAGDPKRLIVVNGLDARFSQEAVDSFGPAIEAGLASCGVTALVIRLSRMELNAGSRVQEGVAGFKPDAILNIRQTESVSRNGDVTFGEYLLTLSEAARKREVWKASISLSTFMGERERAGPEFSAVVIRQLQADNVLRSCQPGPGKPT